MEQTISDMIRQCTAAMESMSSMMNGMGGMMAGAPGGMSASGGPMTPMIAGDGWSLALAALVGAAVAIGLTLAIRGVGGRRAAALSLSGDAREALDRRYARGEIERETYFRLRADLVAGAAR